MTVIKNEITFFFCVKKWIEESFSGLFVFDLSKLNQSSMKAQSNFGPPLTIFRLQKITGLYLETCFLK